MKIKYQHGKFIFPEQISCSAANISCRQVDGTTNQQDLSGSGVSVTCSEIQVSYPDLENVGFYRHGWNSWSPTSWWSVNKPPYRVWNNPPRSLTAEDAYSDDPEVHQSYLLTAIKLEPGKDFIMLIGALGGESGYFEIGEHLLTARKLPDKIGYSAHTAPSNCDNVSCVSWWVGIGKELSVFRAYANALRKSLGSKAKKLNRYPGTIWSSWYSWFEEISEETIETEIIPAARSGYQVLEIDDGWEKGIGDWQPNTKFPSGLETLANKIRNNDLGFTFYCLR